MAKFKSTFRRCRRTMSSKEYTAITYKHIDCVGNRCNLKPDIECSVYILDDIRKHFYYE